MKSGQGFHGCCYSGKDKGRGIMAGIAPGKD